MCRSTVNGSLLMLFGCCTVIATVLTVGCGHSFVLRDIDFGATVYRQNRPAVRNAAANGTQYQGRRRKDQCSLFIACALI